MDRRGDHGRHGRLRLRDRRARRQQRAAWSACRSPCSKARGATSIDQAARGLPAARPSQAGRRGAGRARSCRRRRRQGCRRAAAGPDPAQEGDRQAEAAARGPGGPQGRPEHQVRHVRVPRGTASRSAPVDDTMLLSFVLDAGKHNHGMDELAELYLDQETIKFSDVAGSGAKQVSFDKVPIDKARDYAAEDADVTLQLWAQFKPRLAREHMVGVYETIERPLIPVLLGMEQAGIKVDAPQLRKLSSEFEKRMGELEQRDPQARRPAVQRRLAQAAGRDPVRRAEAARRPAQQERRVVDRRRHPGGPGRPGPCAAGARSWSIARSPSSRAPTPTRWCASSMPRPAASTPPTR